MPPEPGRSWYALRLRSNFERKAQAYCVARGLIHLLPTYKQKSGKHGGPDFVDKPLFPGYLFASIDLMHPERIEILRAPGAVEFVRFGGQPAAIPDGELDSIRIVTRPESGAVPHPFFREGMRVRVVAGPFAGAMGVLESRDGRRPTLVVSIEMLGRSVGVPIEPEMVEPTI